jgi:hypothetical protein
MAFVSCSQPEADPDCEKGSRGQRRRKWSLKDKIMVWRYYLPNCFFERISGKDDQNQNYENSKRVGNRGLSSSMLKSRGSVGT